MVSNFYHFSRFHTIHTQWNLFFRVDAAIQVLETAKVEIDVPEILKQISLSNVKTIKGSIDERDALRRALEQNPDTFYTKTKDETKFGLVKNRQSSSSSSSVGENTKSKKDSQKRAKANGDSANGDHRQNGTNGSRNGKMNQKRRKESAETRMRKLSNDDLLSPDTPLVGINFKDFINEEKFNKLGVHIQVTLKFFRSSFFEQIFFSDFGFVRYMDMAHMI